MTPLTQLQAWATQRGIALHSVQVVRGGTVLVEAACPPLTLDTPQRMYSVAKSLTGLAVGMLAGEGSISLDDPVMRHMSEYAPAHPWVEETTLRDLLSMQGPHSSTTYKRYDGPWLESYFRITPTQRPGTLFTYDTSGTYVLAALVERVSGESLIDYLRPRLLDPLDVSPGLRIIPGQDGFSSGGSGLVCTPRDLRHLAQLLVGGCWLHGRELVPTRFWEEATTRQADTTTQIWGAQLQGGYGYLTWLPRAGGWLMFGMGGQLVFGDSSRELVIVITADTLAAPGSDLALVDFVLDHLAEQWVDTGAPAERNDLTWPAPTHVPTNAVALRGRWESVSSDATPSALALDLCSDGGSLVVADAAGAEVWRIDVRCGKATHVSVSSVGRATNLVGPAVVTAGWPAPGTLDVRVDALGDELGVLRLRLVGRRDGTVTVRRQGFADALSPSWPGVTTYVPVD